jgi:hypothetical protein
MTEAERSSRLKRMSTDFTKMFVVPLAAVYLQKQPDGVSAKHTYVTRNYYMRAVDRLKVSFLASRCFQKWERIDKDVDWPQISGDVEAQELNQTEWDKAFKEASDSRWWKRVITLFPRGIHPVIPVAFTYLTDSSRDRLQNSPDEFVNIDNLYRREQH